MGQTDHDPDRRVPSFLWLMLGLVLVMLFVGGVMLVGRHAPTPVAPSPGAPAGAAPN